MQISRPTLISEQWWMLHVASGADVTLAYREQELPKGFVEAPDDAKGYYYTLRMDEDKRINKLYVNPKDKGIQNFYLNIMVISRELLIDLINEASLLGKEYLERDVLLPKLEQAECPGLTNTMATPLASLVLRATSMRI